MLKEIDDRIQSIKDEADALDIEGPARTTSSTNRKGQHVGKQEKRRHDPTTSTAKKRGTRKPAIIPLLPEHIIAEDVKLVRSTDNNHYGAEIFAKLRRIGVCDGKRTRYYPFGG
uniref:Transposase n=1 Tax=Angiostrongylus cantonensis TaxID=6313 RepID=A0A0K0D852_ANGCA